MILAIDPGKETGVCLYHGGASPPFCRVYGSDILDSLSEHFGAPSGSDVAVIEDFVNYGNFVGIDSIETIRLSGRIQATLEHFGWTVRYMSRPKIKMALCQSTRANDAAIRDALVRRYGGSKDAAIGTKKNPGPLYGIKSHAWAALALAVAYDEIQKQSHET